MEKRPPISNEVARYVRIERALMLPVDREYETPRIKEIAIRQQEIMDEFHVLDMELIKLTSDDVD